MLSNTKSIILSNTGPPGPRSQLALPPHGRAALVPQPEAHRPGGGARGGRGQVRWLQQYYFCSVLDIFTRYTPEHYENAKCYPTTQFSLPPHIL